MKLEEINTILSKQNAAIIAPAGHGKTEMIVDLVRVMDKKALLLTHTNAGIDALCKRLDRKGVDHKKYSITTIAGFCLRWCTAYPKTANIREMSVNDKEYYPMYYEGMVSIFQNEWARRILGLSYGFVIVDEYQDCVDKQHKIFIEINKSVPVIVFGDPLQAIFGWAGRLVSWQDLCFEKVSIKTYPWRWHKTNPMLGDYLCRIRDKLLPGLSGQKVTVTIEPIRGCVGVIPSSCKYDLSILNMIKRYESVLFITKWPKEQCSFCQSTGGLFQNDEPQGLKDLFNVADKLDSRNSDIVVCAIIEFLESSVTRINQELGSFIKHINNRDYDFSRITKNKEFGNLVIRVYETPSNTNILNVLEWVRENGNLKIFRKELFYELCRAIKLSREKRITINEAAQMIRMQPSLQRKYPGFRLLSSRTLLSKGLEFECVIIDMEKGMSVTDYYVAMTRATKHIILICDKTAVTLEEPNL